MKNIVISTGDWDGVGLEITYKALQHIRPKKGERFFIFFSDRSERTFKEKILKQYSIFSNLLLAISDSKDRICFIKNNISPAKNFESACLLAKEGLVHGLVTGPLSKQEVHRCGLKDNGHTDILRRVLGKQEISMAFWGKHFSVVLATDHIAIADVSKSITKPLIETTIQNTLQGARFLTKNKKPSLGILGLNPHAGEISSLGKEEKEIIAPALQNFSKSTIPIYGPLVPDVCFHNPDYKKHHIYIAMYHDQGLIPFKIYHKKNHGVQISLGSPVVRTSVDHGTAKNIFGKKIADPTSMILAIQKAVEMIE